MRDEGHFGHYGAEPFGQGRRLPGLLVEVRVPLPRLPDGEHLRRDRGVELALAEAAELTGRPLRDIAQVDDEGNVIPVVTIVTDNGGPFRSFRFEAFIATPPELRHVRTRVRTPGQNGSRNAASGR